MATIIKNTDLLRQLANNLKLMPTLDQTPMELGGSGKILPVFVINETGILKSDARTGFFPQVFTVPDGKRWEVEYIHIDVLTSATVGNRNFSAQLRDENGLIIFTPVPDTTVAASLPERFTWSPNISTIDSTASGSGYQVVYFPRHMASGWSVRVGEIVDIDEDADILTSGAMLVREYASSEVQGD